MIHDNLRLMTTWVHKCSRCGRTCWNAIKRAGTGAVAAGLIFCAACGAQMRPLADTVSGADVFVELAEKIQVHEHRGQTPTPVTSAVSGAWTTSALFRPT